MSVVALISAALGALFFLPLLTYRQERSPDGWFTVTAKTRLFDSIIAVMPGQGGDKPGRVTLFGADGRFCGAARLPMVNLIYDLRWDLDRKPRTARIGPIVTWNLDDCSVAASEDW